MTLISNRYWYAKLLLLAALALATNPVLHDLGHNFDHHHSETTENDNKVHWQAQDCCPMCDVMSHDVASHSKEIRFKVVTPLWDLDFPQQSFPDSFSLRSIQTRAPPHRV